MIRIFNLPFIVILTSTLLLSPQLMASANPEAGEKQPTKGQVMSEFTSHRRLDDDFYTPSPGYARINPRHGNLYVLHPIFLHEYRLPKSNPFVGQSELE